MDRIKQHLRETMQIQQVIKVLQEAKDDKERLQCLNLLQQAKWDLASIIETLKMFKNDEQRTEALEILVESCNLSEDADIVAIFAPKYRPIASWILSGKSLKINKTSNVTTNVSILEEATISAGAQIKIGNVVASAISID